MSLKPPDDMVEHDCPQEGRMLIEKGKPCNWCDELDDPESGFFTPGESHAME